MKLTGNIQLLIISLSLNLFIINICSGQALIFLYFFGDKLASEELYLSTEGGLNLSGISNLEKGSIALGANFGLGLHVKLSDRWQVTPQFRPLSLKGVNNTDPIVDLPSDFSLDKTALILNYLDFPILFRYEISKVLFISAGPQISFLSSARQKSTGKYLNESETLLKLDVKKYYKKVDYSFPIEAGYWFRLPDKNSIQNTKMSVFIRYCPGIHSIFKDTEAFGEARISTFQAGVSFSTIKD